MLQFQQNDSNSVAAHGKSIAAGQQLWPSAQIAVSSCCLKVPGSPAGRAELQKVLCHVRELHASWQCSEELLLIRLEHIHEQNDKRLSEHLMAPDLYLSRGCFLLLLSRITF